MHRLLLFGLMPVLLVGCGMQQQTDLATPAASASPEASAEPGDPRIAVEGSRVAATGRVERVAGRPVRLCSLDVVSDLMLRPADYVPPPCFAGIEVQGLDEAVNGIARVEGVLRSDVLIAEVHEPVQPDETYDSRLPDVPCEPPAGGWPDGGAPYDDRSPDDWAITRFMQAHPELAQPDRVMLLRPASNRTVATVVVRNEAEAQRIRAELAPAFPGRTCVVVEAKDIGVATGAISDSRLHAERLMTSAFTDWGPGLRTRFARVQVVRITETMIEVEQDYPPGTLILEPWLTVLD